MKALEAFAATKVGKAWLGQFAKSGQSIGKVKFDSDGKLHKENKFDISFNITNKKKGDGGGSTPMRPQPKYEEGKVSGYIFSIDVESGDGWGTNNSFFNAASTIFHETFIHADLDIKDYFDNGKFDNSNVSDNDKNAVLGMSNHYQHSKVREAFGSMAWDSPNMFPYKAYSGLIQINETYKLGLTPTQIFSAMWNYNGGVTYDPKTGMLIK